MDLPESPARRSWRRVAWPILILALCHCDDGVVDEGEGVAYQPTLPQTLPIGDPYPTVVEAFTLVNSAQNAIHGQLQRPDPGLHPTLSFAAVIFVPGGLNPGRKDVQSPEANELARSGMVVVTFNAEGRVSELPGDLRSEGEENYNGFRNQDTLGELVGYIRSLPYVIPDDVGIYSRSYGITMAAGCAGRHPELGIKYIVDAEGPPESFVTCHEPYALDEDPANDKHELVFELFGHYSSYRDPSPANLAFWEEREAIRFIGAFRGRYLRLQGEWDHAQPPADAGEIDDFDLPPLWYRYKHTVDIVNAAVAGGVPWVRVNLPEQGNAVLAAYAMDELPVVIPGRVHDTILWTVSAINEMARSE